MDERKPYLTAILIQAIYAGMFLISKAVLDDGMNSFVFTFYRQAAASVFLVPIAFTLERKGAPRLTYAIFFKMFMLALFGISFSLNIYGVALRYTSSTLAAAATNTLPAITFFMAVLLRMEVLKMKSMNGMAKVVGIAACLAGDATIAFYKGPHFKFSYHHSHPFSNTSNNMDRGHHVHSTKSWIIGTFLMLTANILWGLWLVLQGQVLKLYPSKLLFTALQCLLSCIQSFFMALASERNPSQWKLGLDIRLLAVAYCGIVVTGITFYLQAWCVEKRGPVFLAMSTPLALVITIICSTFFLGELITLGSVLGGLLMVAGLYSVLWGKSKEQTIKQSTADDHEESPEAKDMP